MQVLQTWGVPPSLGSSILAIIGWTRKSSVALRKSVAANSAGTGTTSGGGRPGGAERYGEVLGKGLGESEFGVQPLRAWIQAVWCATAVSAVRGGSPRLTQPWHGAKRVAGAGAALRASRG